MTTRIQNRSNRIGIRPPVQLNSRNSRCAAIPRGEVISLKCACGAHARHALWCPRQTCPAGAIATSPYRLIPYSVDDPVVIAGTESADPYTIWPSAISIERIPGEMSWRVCVTSTIVSPRLA